MMKGNFNPMFRLTISANRDGSLKYTKDFHIQGDQWETVHRANRLATAFMPDFAREMRVFEPLSDADRLEEGDIVYAAMIAGAQACMDAELNPIREEVLEAWLQGIEESRCPVCRFERIRSVVDESFDPCEYCFLRGKTGILISDDDAAFAGPGRISEVQS
jgi:hypothetical protein